MKDLADSPAWQSAVILAADVRRATGNQRIDTPSRDRSIATATKIAEHIARTVVDRSARGSYADYAIVCLTDLRTQFAVYRHARVVPHDRCDDIEEAASALIAQIAEEAR